MSDEDTDPNDTAFFEGWFSRLRCGGCEEMFEVEDDVSDGDEVRCDACGADLKVSRYA